MIRGKVVGTMTDERKREVMICVYDPKKIEEHVLFVEYDDNSKSIQLDDEISVRSDSVLCTSKKRKVSGDYLKQKHNRRWLGEKK